MDRVPCPEALREMLGRAQAAWLRIDPRRPERLVTPATPAFRCQPDTCNAACCRVYVAPVTWWDAGLLRRGGLDVSVAVIDAEELRPPEMRPQEMRQPPASPRISLRRTDAGACVFLGSDRRCGIYPHRPNGCVLYPYTLAFVDAETQRLLPDNQDPAALDHAVRVAAGRDPGTAAVIPALLRDSWCPGFTDAPLGEAGYARLLLDLWPLDACTTYDRPCARHPDH